MQQAQTDLRHELWYDFKGFCEMLSGDPVLVPDPTNIDGLTRNDLTKISHWSDFELSDVDRLAILTDSFKRFIDKGEDVSVITLWRYGTPLIQQIGGEPCERAVDIVMEAICDDLPLDEIAEMRREAKASTEGAAETRLPANHNANPLLLRLQRLYGGQIVGDKIHRAKVPPSNAATSIVGVIDGSPWVLTPAGEQFSQLPLPPEPIRASPFKLRDPASLAEREWLFGRHYIRRYLTSTVGAGGGGKSAHAVSEALAMVTGRPLLDPEGPRTRPLRVWYVNCEDPQDEIDRRFHAAARYFNVTAVQLGDRLFTDSGRDQEFVIMRQEGREFKVCQPLIDEMATEIRLREIDVVIIDPLVSTHEVPENDNGAMQRVSKAWLQVAEKGNCCVEVIHHVVKNSAEVTADSARGGGALKDKTRGMRVINPMTQTEADKAGLEGPEGYFRIDHGKVNLIASGRSQWRRFTSVPLMNGKGLIKTGDEIGVVESWRWPSQDDLAERAATKRQAVVADVPGEALAGLKARLGAGEYKADSRAKWWAGEVLVEIGIAADPAEAKAMLAAWIEMGEFEVVERMDPSARHPRKYLVPVCDG